MTYSGGVAVPKPLRVMATARAGLNSGRSSNCVAVARKSNIPEPTRDHGVVHLGIFSQYRGAVLGSDRNDLLGNPFAITARPAVHGGTVAVAKTIQEILRDLPSIHPYRALRQGREHALQARQVK